MSEKERLERALAVATEGMTVAQKRHYEAYRLWRRALRRAIDDSISRGTFKRLDKWKTLHGVLASKLISNPEPSPVRASRPNEESDLPEARRFWDLPVSQPNSKWRRYWNFLMCVVILANIFTVPFIMTFKVRWMFVWYCVDYIGDALQILDIFFNFSVAFFKDGMLVMDKLQIRFHYLQRWFAFDAFAMLPIDVLFIFRPKMRAYVRLLRFIRCARMGGLVRSWEGHTAHPQFTRLAKLVVGIFLITHVVACVYYEIVTPDPGNPLIVKLEKSGTMVSYFKCVFHGFTLLIGQGGVEDMPEPPLVFTASVICVGVFLFALVIGNVNNVLETLNADNDAFQERVDAVNDFMLEHNIPLGIQDRVRSYYSDLRDRVQGWLIYTREENEAMRLFPPHLRKEVSMALHAGLLKKVSIFSGIKDEGFFHVLAQELRPQMYTPGDDIVVKGELGHEMYFISRGKVDVILEDGTKVGQMEQGDVFGEISVLYSGRRTATIRAKTYVDVYVLTKDAVDRALHDYDDVVDDIYAMAELRLAFSDINERKRFRKQNNELLKKRGLKSDTTVELTTASTFIPSKGVKAEDLKVIAEGDGEHVGAHAPPATPTSSQSNLNSLASGPTPAPPPRPKHLASLQTTRIVSKNTEAIRALAFKALQTEAPGTPEGFQPSTTQHLLQQARERQQERQARRGSVVSTIRGGGGDLNLSTMNLGQSQAFIPPMLGTTQQQLSSGNLSSLAAMPQLSVEGSRTLRRAHSHTTKNKTANTGFATALAGLNSSQDVDAATAMPAHQQFERLKRAREQADNDPEQGDSPWLESMERAFDLFPDEDDPFQFEDPVRLLIVQDFLMRALRRVTDAVSERLRVALDLEVPQSSANSSNASGALLTLARHPSAPNVSHAARVPPPTPPRASGSLPMPHAAADSLTSLVVPASPTAPKRPPRRPSPLSAPDTSSSSIALSIDPATPDATAVRPMPPSAKNGPVKAPAPEAPPAALRTNSVPPADEALLSPKAGAKGSSFPDRPPLPTASSLTDVTAATEARGPVRAADSSSGAGTPKSLLPPDVGVLRQQIPTYRVAPPSMPRQPQPPPPAYGSDSESDHCQTPSKLTPRNNGVSDGAVRRRSDTLSDSGSDSGEFIADERSAKHALMLRRRDGESSDGSDGWGRDSDRRNGTGSHGRSDSAQKARTPDAAMLRSPRRSGGDADALGLTPRLEGLTPRLEGLSPRLEGLSPRLTPREGAFRTPSSPRATDSAGLRSPRAGDALPNLISPRASEVRSGRQLEFIVPDDAAGLPSDEQAMLRLRRSRKSHGRAQDEAAPVEQAPQRDRGGAGVGNGVGGPLRKLTPAEAAAEAAARRGGAQGRVHPR